MAPWFLVFAAFTIGIGETPVAASTSCVGDCNSDSEVTIDEIIVMVNRLLDGAQASPCFGIAGSQGDAVATEDVLAAVTAGLVGCGRGDCAPDLRIVQSTTDPFAPLDLSGFDQSIPS